jgi:ketosteroid isomerase-like protein
MSFEKTEIVRSAIDAMNRHDWDAVIANAAPDFELDLSRALSHLRGVYRLDDLAAYWEEYTADWESIRIEPEELIEDGEHVVVPSRVRGVGRGGIEVDARICITYTFRDGEITRTCMYQGREEALEALGIGFRSS